MDDSLNQPPNDGSLAATPVARSVWRLRYLCVLLPLTTEFAVLWATGTIGKFVWLFQQAASLFVAAWPLTLVLAIWIWHSYRVARQADVLHSRRLLWLVPLLIVPTAVLVWGAVFANARGQGNATWWHLTAFQGAFYLTVAIGVLAVVFNAERRSFVASVATALLLFSFSCSFTAGSSITGDWL